MNLNFAVICRGGSLIEGGKDSVSRKIWLSGCYGLPGTCSFS